MNQAVILAGGKGVRMGNETLLTPKPMIRIGKMPILWHIMKHLYTQGIQEFIILGGYKIEIIRDFFRNYGEEINEITFYGYPLGRYPHTEIMEAWKVGVIDTGLDTPTAGRLLKARDYLRDSFLLTYGDGLANVDVMALEDWGHSSETLVTITGVHPPGRFGALTLDDGRLIDFKEKALSKEWINGGYWYMKKKALGYFLHHEMLEQGGIQRLIAKDMVEMYTHEGFWHPMDTGRDKDYLTELWDRGDAPWKNWE